MEKFASTSTLPRLLAMMCFVLACCSTDESVEVPENTVSTKAEAKSDPDFFGEWSTSQVSFYFMNFNGGMEFRDVLVGWSGWPEQEADAKLDSIDSELRPAFTGGITFKPDHTYDSNLGILSSSGEWQLTDSTLTLDAGLAGKTVLRVESISDAKLEVYHYHNIWVYFENVLDEPGDISVMVGTRMTFTK